MIDPFSTAPDEAQASPEPTTHGYVETMITAAPVDSAPTVGSVKVAVTPVIDPDVVGTKVRVTYKGGVGYDAPWITVDAVTVKDALDQVTEQNAVLLAQLMTEVSKAGKHFAGLYSPNTAPVTSPQAAAVSPSAPPAGATAPSNGETRACKHGAMQYKTGVSAKNGKTWQAFMCPTPKGAPDQCEAQWIR